VDSLVFTWSDSASSTSRPDDLSCLRLFSTTGGTLLVEWDLSSGSIKRTLPSQGGAIWCLAPNPAGTLLAIGCEDGCVRVVDIADDEFVLKRKFDRIKTRILSVAWGPPVAPQKRKLATVDADGMEEEESSEDEEGDDEWSDEWLVTGCSDSSLRKWDVKSGRVVERMSTDRTRNEPTLVWAVGVLSCVWFLLVWNLTFAYYRLGMAQ
jgi:U3 small nucleolar RNA-associated protein 4